MIKELTIAFLFIATIFLGSLSFALIQSNVKISIENNDLDEELALYEDIINFAAEELRDCKIERNEWRSYYGGIYGLEQARRYYNTPAIDWEEPKSRWEILEEDMIDIFEEDLSTTTDE